MTRLSLILWAVCIGFVLFVLLWIEFSADSCVDAGGAFHYREFRCDIDTYYVPLADRPQKPFLLLGLLIASCVLSFGSVFIFHRWRSRTHRKSCANNLDGINT